MATGEESPRKSNARRDDFLLVGRTRCCPGWSGQTARQHRRPICSRNYARQCFRNEAAAGADVPVRAADRCFLWRLSRISLSSSPASAHTDDCRYGRAAAELSASRQSLSKWREITRICLPVHTLAGARTSGDGAIVALAADVIGQTIATIRGHRWSLLCADQPRRHDAAVFRTTGDWGEVFGPPIVMAPVVVVRTVPVPLELGSGRTI